MRVLTNSFGCSPSVAQEELTSNPNIERLLHTASYENAFRELERWEKKQSKVKEPDEPSGFWIDLVRENEMKIAEEDAKEHQDWLESEDRI